MPKKSSAQKIQESETRHEESEKLGSGIKSWGKGSKNDSETESLSEQSTNNILYQTKKKSK